MRPARSAQTLLSHDHGGSVCFQMRPVDRCRSDAPCGRFFEDRAKDANGERSTNWLHKVFRLPSYSDASFHIKTFRIARIIPKLTWRSSIREALRGSFWTRRGLMPLQVLIYAALASNATGLSQPNAECWRRGLEKPLARIVAKAARP